MKKEGKHIDKVFSERLVHLNVIPPTDVWETVEQRSFRKKRNLLPLYRLAAASVLLMMILGSFWLFFLRKPVEEHLADQPALSGTHEAIKPGNQSEPLHTLQHKTLPESVDRRNEQNQTALKQEPETSAAGKTEKHNTSKVRVTQHDLKKGTSTAFTDLNRQSLYPVQHRETVTQMAYAKPGMMYPDLAYSLHYGERQVISSWPEAAEVQQDVSKKQAVWSLGGDVGPFYSYRILATQDKFYSDYLNTQENGIFAYAGGINVYYSKGQKRLSVQTGIHYARMGLEANDVVAFKSLKNGDLALLETKGNEYIHLSEGRLGYDENPIFIANVTSPSGMDQTEYLLSRLGADSYETVDISLKQDMSFIEIPLILRYQVVDGGLGFNLIGGVGTSILIDGRSMVINGDQVIPLGNTGDLRRTNLNGIAGIGMSYRLSDLLSFQLEPTFKYYLNPLNKASSVYAHPYSFGVYSGIRFTF